MDHLFAGIFLKMNLRNVLSLLIRAVPKVHTYWMKFIPHNYVLNRQNMPEYEAFILNGTMIELLPST